MYCTYMSMFVNKAAVYNNESFKTDTFRISKRSLIKMYNKYLETSFCMRAPPNFNLKSNKFGYSKYGKEAANICDVFSD